MDFVRSYIGTNDPLTSWTFFPHCAHSKTSQKVRKKCSTGQRFIFTKVTSYKIHILSTRHFYGYPLIKTSSLVHTQQLVQSRNWRRRHAKKKISGFYFLSIFWRICSLSGVCTSMVYINFLTLKSEQNQKLQLPL